MTDSNLLQFFNSPRVIDTIRDLNSRQLEREIEEGLSKPDESAVDLLRLAAITSFVNMLGDNPIHIWFRPSSDEIEKISEISHECFFRWRGYINALDEINKSPSIDDILMFSVSGLIAKRDHEVRDELRSPSRRLWLDALLSSLSEFPWIDRVRASISIAILYIIRQENRDDVSQGNLVLQQLADLQKSYEVSWIIDRSTQTRDASILIGFYHLAESVILTAKFLTDGVIEINGKRVSDFSAELRRLLVRAEEYLMFSGDSEHNLWLQTAASAVVHLRSSSIWVQAKGISDRIDRLLDELVSIDREQPVFSLLPAQQEALRKSLLDSSRMAIVLQMPTSAGKTLLAEFSLLQTFDAFREAARAVYIVPTRALATQVRRTLTEDLRPLGINISAAGSAFEEDPYELQLLEDSDGVIVSTPEKLDLLLRSHPEWFTALRLVVVDEAHLIQDNERGARLELLLVNIRREQPDARLLLLTPFMENAQEIAEWLSRDRPNAISVDWRPTRVLLGMANVSGGGKRRSLTIEWRDPYHPEITPRPLKVPCSLPSSKLQSNTDKVLYLADKFQPLGTVLAMYSAAPAEAEKAAIKQAEKRDNISYEELSPQLRVAIGIARQEFGANSMLAYCLERGVAFHHSSLSPIIRYLIEDQIRNKKITFVAATSTLAQGMNFPVATILVHSVHKPYGAGNFTPSEFWNMAGRAGRVGLSEQGIVLFTNISHQKHLDCYSNALSQSLYSAMLMVLESLDPDMDVKQQYRDIPVIRPFIQYLAHAAATSSVGEVLRNLEALVEQSLINQQIPYDKSSKLRGIARSYLKQLLKKNGRLLKTADVTGLATFSFEELYAKLRGDPILKNGPGEVLNRGQEGLYALVDALKWLPELNLAIGFGKGKMNVEVVSRVVQRWIDGLPVYEIAKEFPGDDEASRIREASRYLNSTISQTLSWGAHAFMKGWVATPAGTQEIDPREAILPSLIQYGVKTPEAAIASLLGVPRSFAEATGYEYRERHGNISTESVGNLRAFVENTNVNDWKKIIDRASVPDITGEDFYVVFREMQGLVV